MDPNIFSGNDYKNTIKDIINKSKSGEKNDEEIIIFFNSNFMKEYEYSEDQEGSLDTVDINFSKSRDSSNTSLNKFVRTDLDDNDKDKDNLDNSFISAWIKYLLLKCCCIDDE